MKGLIITTAPKTLKQLFAPVKSLSRESAVLNELAAYVERQDLGPGDKLPSERALCEVLGVGRSTVREALKRWMALGIIDLRQGSGAYLRVKVSPNLMHVPLVLAQPQKARDVLHILEVRRALEGEAAALCAAHGTPEEIAVIAQALHRLEAVPDYRNASNEDWHFHNAIYQATGNPLFPQLIQSVQNLLHLLWENPLHLQNFAASSYPFHRIMYEAIARRDAAAARNAAWSLIDSVANEIRQAFPEADKC